MQPRTVEECLSDDLNAIAQLTADKNRQSVEELVAKIVESGVFEPAPKEPVREGDKVIAEMTPRQKALHCIFQNGANNMDIRKYAYNLMLQEIGSDEELQKKASGKNGVGMCVGFVLVAY